MSAGAKVRKTLTLDPQLLDAAGQLAQPAESLSAIVNELAWEGLRQRQRQRRAALRELVEDLKQR